MAGKDIWKILEIEKTKDEGAIKAAYRKKVVTVNPEDDAAGFQRLREAYDEALLYAGEPEKEESQEPETELDVLMDRAEEIYMNLDSRLDEELWREWLSDPLCVGLDTSDQVREVFLAFIMGHFYFPHNIWVMFDKCFQIVSEKKILSEVFPEDYLDYVHFHIENEDFFDFNNLMPREKLRQLFAENGIKDVQIGDGTYKLKPEEFEAAEDSYIHLCSNYLAKLDYIVNNSREAEDWEEKREAVCDILCYLETQDIWHPFEYAGKMRYLFCIGDADKAREMAENIVVRDFLPVFDCYTAACAGNLLLQQGYDQYDVLERVFERVLEIRPAFIMALIGMARLRRAQDNYVDAKEYVFKVLRTDGQNEEAIKLLNEINDILIVRYQNSLKEHPDSQEDIIELGWCLFQYERGQEVLALLDGVEPDEEHEYQYMNLKGRCLCNLLQYKEALPYLKRWNELLLEILEESEGKKPEELDEKVRDRISRIAFSYYLLGVCLKETDSYKEAEQMLLLSIEKEENETERVYYRETLGRLYQETGRYNEAMEIYNSMIEEFPHCVPAYVQRQELYYEQRDGQGVVDDYYHIIEDAPDYAKAYVLAAKVFLIYEQYEDAAKVFKTAEENHVKSDALLLAAANCLRETEKYKEAAELFDKMAGRLKNEDNDIENICEFYNDAAYSYLCVEEYEKASACLEQVFALEKENKRAMWLQIDLLKRTNAPMDKISGVYERMLILFNEDANVHYEYGVFLMRIGDDLGAEERFLAALHRMPKHQEANDKLMRIYQNRYVNTEKEEDFEKALEYANRQLENNDDGYFYVDRGLLLIDAYRFDEAIADFVMALEQNQENVYALNACGYCYLLKEDYEKAEECLKKALSFMEPGETVHPYVNLIKAYEMQEKYDQAIECSKKLLSEFSPEMSWYRNLAVIYTKKGDYTSAREQYLIRHAFYMDKFNTNKGKNDNPWVIERLVQNVIDIIKITILAGDIEQRKKWENQLHSLVKQKRNGKLLQLATEKHSLFRGAGFKWRPNEGYKQVYISVLKAVGKHALYEERNYEQAMACFMQAYSYMDTLEQMTEGEDLKNLAELLGDMAETAYRLDRKKKAGEYATLGLKALTKACGSEEAYLSYASEGPYRLGELAMLYFYQGNEEKARYYADEMGKHLRCSFCRHGRCYEQYLWYARMAEAKGDYRTAYEQYSLAYKYGSEDCEAYVAMEAMKKLGNFETE